MKRRGDGTIGAQGKGRSWEAGIAPGARRGLRDVGEARRVLRA